MTLSSLTRVQFLALALAAVISFGGFALPARAASDSDGSGIMTVTPDTVQAGESDLSFTFDFSENKQYPVLQRLFKSFLQVGSQVRLTVPDGWTKPQLTDSGAPGYVSITSGEGGGWHAFNTCGLTFLEASTTASESGPWVVTIPQHCGYQDHLLISYSGVTAPEDTGPYSFITLTRAGFGIAEIDESPVVNVVPVCESGFHVEDFSCVADYPPSCGDGFHVGDEGMCVPDNYDAPLACPEGFSYDSESDMCVATPVVPTCADGLTYDAETNMCVDTEPTEPTCSEGTWNGVHCTMGDDYVDADCPEGEELVGAEEGLGECVLPDEEPTCPPGFSLNGETDMCVANDTAPSCPEHYTLVNDEGGPMCVFVPFEPFCPAGFLMNEEGTGCFPQSPSHGSGGSGSSDDSGSSSSDEGQVLGAETQVCSDVLLTDYLYPNKENDPEQVKKLQEFLNDELGLTLEVNGIYDAATEKAVSDFQVKYWEDVLAPWVPHGLPTDHTPTGLVFKLTLWKINALHCADLKVPAPEL